MYNMYICDNVVHNLQVLGICRPTCNCMARTGPVGGSLATLQDLTGAAKKQDIAKVPLATQKFRSSRCAR